MATAPPKIYTYHCLCSSLLLTSTHSLTSLPRRSGLDKAIIIPLPAKPPVPNTENTENTEEPRSSSPSRSSTPSHPPEEKENEGTEQNNVNQNPSIPKDLPPSGFSMPLHMRADKKPTVIRREDGFERRLLWRCGRCRLIVGYQIASEDAAVELMDVNNGGKGKSGDGDDGQGDEKDLKVLYLLPGGLMSTETMTKKDLRIGDSEVGVLNGLAAWE